MYEGSEDKQRKLFQFSALRLNPLTRIQAVVSCYFSYGYFLRVLFLFGHTSVDQ